MRRTVNNVKHESWIGRFSDWLFGYDFFVSYAQRDGQNLPRVLTRLLKQHHPPFKVCLDEQEYPAGAKLSVLTRRRVRGSRVLLLVARPHAMESRWVKQEVETAIQAKRVIIVVDVNGTYAETDPKHALKESLGADDLLQIKENLSEPDANPNVATIERITNSFKGERQETFRRRIVTYALAFFIALTLAATTLAITSYRQLQSARRNLADAYLKQAQTARQSRRPNEALRLAVEALHHFENRDARRLLAELAPISFLQEHRISDSAIEDMAIALDGRSLAVGCEDGKVWLLDIVSGKRELIGVHSSAVDAVAISPDGSKIASSNFGNELIIWSRKTGNATNRLIVSDFDDVNNHMFSPTFTPDGMSLAAILPDTSAIGIWNVATSKMTDTIPLPNEESYGIADFQFLPNGNGIAYAKTSGRIGIVDFPSFKLRPLWKHPTNAVDDYRIVQNLGVPLKISISSNGKRLAVGTSGSNVWVIDTSDMQITGKLAADLSLEPYAEILPTHWSEYVGFTADGKTLVCANTDGLLSVWNWEEGSLTGIVEPLIPPDSSDNFKALVVSPVVPVALVACSDGRILMYELSGKPFRYCLQTEHFLNQELNDGSQFTTPSTARFTARGDAALIGAFDGSIRKYAYLVGKVVITPRNLNEYEEKGHKGRITFVDSIGGDRIVSIGDDGFLSVWSADFGKQDTWELPVVPTCSALSPDRTRIAFGSEDETVYIWNLKQEKVISKLKFHNDGSCDQLVFSPDGLSIAAVVAFAPPENDRLYIRDLVDQRSLIFRLADDAEPSAVAFSPSNSKLAVACRTNGEIQIWEQPLSQPRLIYRIPNTSDPIAFSPDGLWIAAVRGEDVVILRVKDSLELAILRGHRGQINGLSFDPTSQMILSYSLDETVRIWDLSALMDSYHELDKTIESLTRLQLDGFQLKENTLQTAK